MEARVEGPAGDMAGVTIAGEPDGGAVGRSCRRSRGEVLAGGADAGRWAAPALGESERLRAGRDAV
jgi:hypothetical protein